MKKSVCSYVNFFKGMLSYGAISPYPFEERALGIDWHKVSSDINVAIKKYDLENERK
jgi:hypothetical protein